jgi:hypothetical protein
LPCRSKDDSISARRQICRAFAYPLVLQKEPLGAEPSGISPEEFAKVLRDDARRWAEVIRAAGIKAE